MDIPAIDFIATQALYSLAQTQYREQLISLQTRLESESDSDWEIRKIKVYADLAFDAKTLAHNLNRSLGR